MLKSQPILHRASQVFFSTAKPSVTLPALKTKLKPSEYIEALKYDAVQQRNRMTHQQIAAVRERRTKLIALEKRRAAVNIAKYKDQQLPESTLSFKEKVAQILGSKCLNEDHLMEVISSPKSQLIEREVEQMTKTKERLKKIVEAHIRSRYTEADRKERPLAVRVEEEALDSLYQEQVYQTQEYDFDLEVEGAPRYDLPEWKRD